MITRNYVATSKLLNDRDNWIPVATACFKCVKLEIRVPSYPGFAITPLRPPARGTRQAITLGMNELTLSAEQLAVVTAPAAPAPVVLDDEALMAMPLADAKHLVAAEFERRYLIRVMERAQGSVSEGARLTGLDRTNFRRLLQRHGLR